MYGDDDIRDLTPESWRDRVALVPQDPALFSGTIADNISYGAPSASQSEIEEAARLANALHFIRSLPQGFDTEVGPRGARLSGGQRQRVAIARELVRKPLILVMDEATAALDAQAEAEVNLAVQKVMSSRALTTIIIAHRLSTLKSADRVILYVFALSLRRRSSERCGQHARRHLQGRGLVRGADPRRRAGPLAEFESC